MDRWVAAIYRCPSAIDEAYAMTDVRSRLLESASGLTGWLDCCRGLFLPAEPVNRYDVSLSRSMILECKLWLNVGIRTGRVTIA